MVTLLHKSGRCFCLAPGLQFVNRVHKLSAAHENWEQALQRNPCRFCLITVLSITEHSNEIRNLQELGPKLA